MSKADEMFERLGYEKSTDKRREQYKKILYFNGYKIITTINFYLLDKNLSTQSYNDTIQQKVDTNFETEEMIAINEKVKELGWLDET